jgi:hypothetical protein
MDEEISVMLFMMNAMVMRVFPAGPYFPSAPPNVRVFSPQLNFVIMVLVLPMHYHCGLLYMAYAWLMDHL